MSDTTRLDQIDEEILSYEVSDEALETAAGAGKEKAGNYTLGFCSGFIGLPVAVTIWTGHDFLISSLTARPPQSLRRGAG